MKRIFIVVFIVLAAGILADPAGSSARGQNGQVTTQFTGKSSLIYRVKLNDSTQRFTNGIIATTVTKSDTGKIWHVNLCEPFRRNKNYMGLDPLDNKFAEHKMGLPLKYQANYFSLSEINADTTVKQGVTPLNSLPVTHPAAK
jgi:hypothetical protein